MKLSNIMTKPTAIAMMTPLAIFVFTMMIGFLNAQSYLYDNNSSYSNPYYNSSNNLYSNSYNNSANSLYDNSYSNTSTRLYEHTNDMNTYYSPLDDIRNYDNVYDTFFEDAYFKNYYKSDGTYFRRYYWLNMVGY